MSLLTLTTHTLIDQLLQDLSAIDPKSLRGVEAELKHGMGEWWSAFKDEKPCVELVVGVFIARSQASAGSDGFGLYFCTPPNTVTGPILPSSQGYIGHSGWKRSAL